MLSNVEAIFKGKIASGSTAISAVSIVVSMVILCLDVIGRYAFNSPLKGATAIVNVSVIYTAFFALVPALVRGAHVKVDLVTSRLSPRLKAICEVFSAVICLVFFGVMVFSTWRLFLEAFAVKETLYAEIDVPLWPAKLSVVICAALMCVGYVIELARKSALFSQRKA